MIKTSKEVAQKLLQINAIKLSPKNPFTWASGLRSPIYCDNRMILSHPTIRNFVGEQLKSCSTNFSSFDHISGVATAGIAHGLILADRLDLPFSYVRSKAKAHGRQNLIEGSIEEGSKVLLVEDLISTGGSALQAVEAVRALGVEVVGVLAIFTYEFEKAKNAFADAKCPLFTLSNYSTLLETALEIEFIPEDDFLTLKKWNSDPEKWSTAFQVN